MGTLVVSVVVALVVGAGCVLGGARLMESSPPLGRALQIAGALVAVLGLGRAAMSGARTWSASDGAPAAGPVDGATVHDLCMTSTPFSVDRATRSFCLCTERAYGAARTADDTFVLSGSGPGQLYISGGDVGVRTFRTTFAGCASGALGSWINLECATGCEGDDACESGCGCVGLHAARARTQEELAEMLWPDAAPHAGVDPIRVLIDQAVVECSRQ